MQPHPYRTKIPHSRATTGMGTRFGCNDNWNRLDGQALITYDWWMVFKATINQL